MSAYKEMQTDFRIFSPAYVLQTGIGFAASYTIYGTILLRDGLLSAHGRASIPLAAASPTIRPQIDAFLVAELSRASGEHLMTKRFSRARESFIPTDWNSGTNIFLGGTEFVLPLPPEPLMLKIKGNVVYTFTEGKAVANPLFPPEETFAIEVEE